MFGRDRPAVVVGLEPSAPPRVGRLDCRLRGAIMASNKECVDHARECVRLAGLAQDPELRERLLNIAREWMATAMHERLMPEAKPLMPC
jgi:hypothetical protein